MGLPPAGIADHHDILAVLDKLAGGQLMEKGRGDRLVELGEIELVQGLLEGKPRRLEPPPELVFLP